MAVFEHQAGAGAAIELLVVEAILLAPCLLGSVHGRIGCAPQAFYVATAVRVRGDTDAHAQAHVQPIDLMADGNALEQPLGVAPGLLGIGQAVEQRGEFVPAHACQQRFTAQAILELLGHPAQDPVTGIMTKGVVDTLEAIEVHVHQGLRPVRTLIAQQRPFGRLVEPTASEQTGERVGNGLVFELLVQVVHRRHVQHGYHHRLLLGRQGRT